MLIVIIFAGARQFSSLPFFFFNYPNWACNILFILWNLITHQIGTICWTPGKLVECLTSLAPSSGTLLLVILLMRAGDARGVRFLSATLVLDHNQQIPAASLVTFNATPTPLWGLRVGQWVMTVTTDLSPEAPKPCSLSLPEHLPPSSSPTECTSRGRGLILNSFSSSAHQGSPWEVEPADGTEGKLITTERNLLPTGFLSHPLGQGNRDWENVEPGREMRSSGLQMEILGPELMSNVPWIPHQVGGHAALPLQPPEK